MVNNVPPKVELVYGRKPHQLEQGFPHAGYARGTGKPEDLEALARLMDSVFRIPGLNLRFGFDAIIGLVPGIGDILSSLVSIFILHHASQNGVSRITLARMGLNIATDILVGSIPFLGDLFDVYWKANNRNVALLKQHLNATPPEQKRLRRSDTFFVVLMSLGLLLLLAASVMVATTLIVWLATMIRNAF